jgi:hypothetical protein
MGYTSCNYRLCLGEPQGMPQPVRLVKYIAPPSPPPIKAVDVISLLYGPLRIYLDDETRQGSYTAHRPTEFSFYMCKQCRYQLTLPSFKMAARSPSDIYTWG